MARRLDHERANRKARVTRELRDEALERDVPRNGGRGGGNLAAGSAASRGHSEHRNLQIIVNDLRKEISRLQDDHANLKQQYGTLERRFEKRLSAVEKNVRRIMERMIANYGRPIGAQTGGAS